MPHLPSYLCTSTSRLFECVCVSPTFDESLSEPQYPFLLCSFDWGHDHARDPLKQTTRQLTPTLHTPTPHNKVRPLPLPACV